MPSPLPDPLVSTEWLASHLGESGLRILDGSHHLPTAGRHARAEYGERHIPGAVFFDIDAIADPDTSLPHMLPSPEKFAADVGALGISNDDRVVVYDAVGTTGAARVWWTFRAFGHDAVAVLDGGLPKWLAEGRPVSAMVPALQPKPFTARFRPELVRSVEHMLANLTGGAEQVLDARSAGRFAGTEPEPRAGMRSGHIPGSRNLPYTELLNPDRTFRAPDEIAALFAGAGVDLSRPLVTTCGSGVTASVLALGAYLAGKRDVAVYDGSWSEWGSRSDTPIET